MARYTARVEIRAPPERVWRVLTAFDRYPEWNPQIPQAAGIAATGERITLRLALPNRPAVNLSAQIEEASPGRKLSWRGHLLAPWFFEGYREFAVEETGAGRVSLTHVEDVHGLFAPLFLLVMGKGIATSQNALNEALRVRAEGAGRL